MHRAALPHRPQAVRRMAAQVKTRARLQAMAAMASRKGRSARLAVSVRSVHQSAVATVAMAKRLHRAHLAAAQLAKAEPSKVIRSGVRRFVDRPWDQLPRVQ